MADLKFLKSFTKGDEAKIRRYVSMYLKVAPDILGKMSEDLEAENWSDLAIQAHSLKPQADFMGIPELKAVLMEIEKSVKMGDLNSLPSLYERAVNLHEEAELSLRAQLDIN